MFFDLSWSHILLFLIITLVVVGPKDLPKMMRTAGRWMARARAMADQLRRSFDEMARQSELDELRSEIQALREQRPLADIDRSLHQSILPQDAPTVPTANPAPAPDTEPAPAKEPELAPALHDAGADRKS